MADGDAGAGAAPGDETDTATGSGGRAAVTVPTQSEFKRFRTRPNSLSSIDRPQRALIATHSATYVQRNAARGGSQLLGSLSLLLRFDDALVARKERGSEVSLANAVR